MFLTGTITGAFDYYFFWSLCHRRCLFLCGITDFKTFCRALESFLKRSSGRTKQTDTWTVTPGSSSLTSTSHLSSKTSACTWKREGCWRWLDPLARGRSVKDKWNDYLQTRQNPFTNHHRFFMLEQHLSASEWKCESMKWSHMFFLLLSPEFPAHDDPGRVGTIRR